MRRSYVISLLVIAVAIPATLYLGTLLPGRMYWITGTLMILETMLPFFVSFERRKPQARELVTVAVMCALAVAARVVIQIPNFKPMLGIILLTGIALGPETGFMTGAVSAFASNFFFSQGPWTPWQMMAYGIGGFVAGLVFSRVGGKFARSWLYTLLLSLFGFVTIVAVVGPLLDTCTLFTVGGRITPTFAAAVYASGLPHNVTHGMATAVTMLLLARPLLWKLDRLKTKYGLLAR